MVTYQGKVRSRRKREAAVWEDLELPGEGVGTQLLDRRMAFELGEALALGGIAELLFARWLSWRGDQGRAPESVVPAWARHHGGLDWVDGWHGTRETDRYRSAEARAPHTGLLSTPALSRLMFFLLGHTVWHVGILVFHPGRGICAPYGNAVTIGPLGSLLTFLSIHVHLYLFIFVGD